MTKVKLEPVEILVIADKSGSMESLRDEVVTGFNKFLKEQQDDETIDSNITVVQFNGEVKTCVDRKPVKEVSSWTMEDFTPSGFTALYDAVGISLSKLLETAAKNAIVAIITDGQENASKVFKHAHVQQIIKFAKARGWEVMFLAQNMDAEVVGRSYGITNNLSAAAGAAGMEQIYRGLTSTTTSYKASVVSSLNKED